MPFTHHSSPLVLLPTNQLVSALTIGTSQDISGGLLDVEGELAHDSIPCPTPSVALNPNSINSFNSCQSKCKNSMLGNDPCLLYLVPVLDKFTGKTSAWYQ